MAQTLLACTSIVIGIAVTIVSAVVRRAARASLGWPTAQGRVIRAWVQEETGTRMSSHLSRGGMIGHTRLYMPRVEYEYVVAGRCLVGRRRAFVEAETVSRAPAQKVVDAYPAGAGVEVSYNPRNPSTSVLIPGGANGAVISIFAAIGVLFVLIGILFMTGAVSLAP